MIPNTEVKTPAACTGCREPLTKDPRGFNTCSTDGCWGNLVQRFPVEAPVKQKNRRRRGRRKSARN